MACHDDGALAYCCGTPSSRCSSSTDGWRQRDLGRHCQGPGRTTRAALHLCSQSWRLPLGRFADGIAHEDQDQTGQARNPWIDLVEGEIRLRLRSRPSSIVSGSGSNVRSTITSAPRTRSSAVRMAIATSQIGFLGSTTTASSVLPPTSRCRVGGPSIVSQWSFGPAGMAASGGASRDVISANLNMQLRDRYTLCPTGSSRSAPHRVCVCCSLWPTFWWFLPRSCFVDPNTL
jgi:hypothetical protein